MPPGHVNTDLNADKGVLTRAQVSMMVAISRPGETTTFGSNADQRIQNYAQPDRAGVSETPILPDKTTIMVL